MAQQQGNSTSSGGRLDGSVQQNPVLSTNFALGVGWGTTATVAVRAGSTDQRGVITVTSNGTGQAQATATVTFTFADGAYSAVPPYMSAVLINNSHAVGETGATGMTCTTTQLALTHSVLPVAAATYVYAYAVIA